MSEDQKKQLEQQLWKITDTLRGTDDTIAKCFNSDYAIDINLWMPN